MRASWKTAGALAVMAVMAVMASVVAPASAARTTVRAEADAFVYSSRANYNTGSSEILRIRNAEKFSYLRFDVPALPAGESITRATLMVYATSGSHCTLGAKVFRAANDTWSEHTITWKNQPGMTGSVLASATWKWTSTGYKSFDVTAAVTGAGRASFVLRHAQACRAGSDARIQSREAGSNRPRLVVETAAGPPPPACSDRRDNDADGLIDHPSDPGCTGGSDTDEAAGPAPTGVKIAAAGDVVCAPTYSNYDGGNQGSCQHRLTDDLLSGADAVLPLGDLQYPDGTLATFNQAYDPSWGQYAAKTYPVPGNHEYHVAGAEGFFDYWASKGRPTGDSGNGYYSFDLGPWHLIALNSSDLCTAGPPCAEGSPQNNFLEQDLAGTTKSCIAAYWHHPLFNSGAGHGEAQSVRPFWDDLYAAGADIVLNGHVHNYQRFAKQDPTGRAVANGIRQFIVGTGGRSFYGLQSPPEPNLEFGQADSFGVLRLTLGTSSYSWAFVDISGSVLDRGGPVACN